ncbi:MAG: universal stress protein [Candidatus Thermoplasmatota archaeon]|jgi:nucleotide-binding universal stress UspA family protein|nr:universal stress protein [Candidatus Thermoplasmatota archaeon]MBS3802165.1 universal stress protein [Candidatus Thermoplasmatota archaeon]
MKKLLIAYDGSDASKKAIDVAIQSALPDDELVLLTVIPAELTQSSFTKMLLPTIDMSSIVQSGSFKERAMESLGEIAKGYEPSVGKVSVAVESGDPADEILLSAKKHGADMIVLGYKGYGKEGRFLLGSVTDKVVRYAGTSVLVVR